MADGPEVGTPRVRREDGPLLRGEGDYTADIQLDEALHMAVVRSRYGHAGLDVVETSDAEQFDGVHAVFTAEQVSRSDAPGVIAPTSTASSLAGVDDPAVPARARTALSQPKRPFLASDRVRYVGEPIAVVLAEDRYIAHDAVARVDVTYDRLEAITDPRRAVEPDAPRIHDDVTDNVAFDWEVGDGAAVDEAFATATTTISVDIDHQRLVPTSLEPRAALAEYDRQTERLTVRMGTQGPHRARTILSESLGLPEARIRVIAPEVGGGFGAKSKFYTEEPLAAWCALQTGRPVRWQATRSESFQADIHGRARTVQGELALDRDGTIRGLRVESYANLGAYVSRGAPGTRTGSFVDVLSGQYAIPAIYCRVVGCHTTTVPVDSYRGSSRPMTILTLERLLDTAAREIGLDPAELRRRNFIPPDEFPYETPVGEVYDSGTYEAAFDRALELVGYDDVRERQATLAAEGRFLGVGCCCVMDNAGTGRPESGRIRFSPDGTVRASVGTADQGQGHRTTFAQLVADLLGVPFDDVSVREGDTDVVPTGGGASGSRSVVCGGEALRATAESVVEQARGLAAEQLEADPIDVRFEEGSFHVAGAADRAISLQQIARYTHEVEPLPSGVHPGLESTETRSSPATFPFGTHVAVVEVDPHIGAVDLCGYAAVDDAGVPLNPLLIEGQVIGGVVQGIGQALFEAAIYDETGSLVTGSLLDYSMVRAGDLPEFELDQTVTPSPYNALGVKGAGESGATAAPAAVANAVVDALAPLGIGHLDLPMTPERIWRAIAQSDGPRSSGG